MADQPVKGTKRLTTANTMTNAVGFLIEQIIRDTVNTAELVIVKNVYAGGSGSMTGYVDVMPLVCQTDAYNNTLPTSTIFHLPYSRVQGGIAALVIDPSIGDIGIAIFVKRDSSGVKQGATEPVQPASFRSFDQADGFYIGGFLNKQPAAWLEIGASSGEIDLHTTIANVNIASDSGNITINAPNGTIVATTQTATVNASMTTFNGSVTITDGLLVGGIARGIGNNALKMQGGLENITGTIVSNGITLESHVHSGVDTGPSNTGGPIG